LLSEVELRAVIESLKRWLWQGFVLGAFLFAVIFAPVLFVGGTGAHGGFPLLFYLSPVLALIIGSFVAKYGPERKILRLFHSLLMGFVCIGLPSIVSLGLTALLEGNSPSSSAVVGKWGVIVRILVTWSMAIGLMAWIVSVMFSFLGTVFRSSHVSSSNGSLLRPDKPPKTGRRE
jgi:hypothetical protein